MQHSAEMRRCLIDCDIVAVRRLWQHVAPGLPQPDTDADALISLHFARTMAGFVPFKLRAYSHRWLLDQGYPSGLPDNLKPKAERIYPRIVDGVGIAMKTNSELMRPLLPVIRGSMEDAVMGCYADKQTEPEFVKARMREAKSRSIEKLLGSFSGRSFVSLSHGKAR